MPYAYLNTFQTFGLLETWKQDEGNMPNVWQNHDYVFVPASKRFNRGRAMGGIYVYVLRTLKQYVTGLAESCDFAVFLKIDRFVIGSSKDIILSFVYLPPYDSPFYLLKPEKGIKLFEEELLDLNLDLDDVHMVIIGDVNARTGELSEIIEPDPDVPALNEFKKVFNNPDEFGNRVSCDKAVNRNDREVLQFC